MILTKAQLVSNVTPYFIRVYGTSDFFAAMMYVQVAIGVSVGGIASGFVFKRYGSLSPVRSTLP